MTVPDSSRSLPAALAIGLLLAQPLQLARGDEAHPTLEEFREELQRADLVLRGYVEKVVGEEPLEGEGTVQSLRLRVTKVYSGSLERPTITLKIVAWTKDQRCPKGTDLFLPIQVIRPHPDDPEPFGQSAVYAARFRYRVQDGQVVSNTNMADDLKPYYTSPARFENLIERIVSRGGKKTRWRSDHSEYVPGRVLFFDDFNDGSLAGWTLLQGSRANPVRKGPAPPVEFVAEDPYEVWMSERTTWKNEYGSQAGSIGRLARNPETGRLEGTRNGSLVQIGVYYGRLRLRSSQLHQHITIVAGDPNWTDYQVDVDVFDRFDRGIDAPTLIAQPDYKKLGLFGRVTVPNVPKTRGEHTELGVELGTYGNHEATFSTIGLDAFQIRLKVPDIGFPRDWGNENRKTKVLDFETYRIKHETPIHITAKFMGRRVEGWIDGQKYIEGLIPDSNWPEFQRGRIALWVFETFAEFDNVKVTELVPKSAR